MLETELTNNPANRINDLIIGHLSYGAIAPHARFNRDLSEEIRALLVKEALSLGLKCNFFDWHNLPSEPKIYDLSMKERFSKPVYCYSSLQSPEIIFEPDTLNVFYNCKLHKRHTQGFSSYENDDELQKDIALARLLGHFQGGTGRLSARAGESYRAHSIQLLILVDNEDAPPLNRYFSGGYRGSVVSSGLYLLEGDQLKADK